MLARLRLQQRVRGLCELKGSIRRLSERIRYTSAPMETLLGEIYPIPTGESFPPNREEWDKHFLRWGEERGLSADDQTVLSGFISGLGHCDVEGEVNFCEEYHAVVDERLEQAREQLKTKGRVYPMLGVCGGLLTALLLW